MKRPYLGLLVLVSACGASTPAVAPTSVVAEHCTISGTADQLVLTVVGLEGTEPPE